jgi:hypothetical protein
MKKTVLLMSSNREMEKPTRESVKRLTALGAVFMLETGSACVGFARSRALSLACEQLRGAWSDRDVVLMLDDDMEFDSETAQLVVDKARELGRPTAAAYATITRKLAAARWKNGLWVVGLGCVAIPVPLLLELENKSESFEMNGKVYSAFTWSAPEHGEWLTEDYRLSQRLGGVHLMPLAVGHIKKGSIWPDDETLEKIGKFEVPT